VTDSLPAGIGGVLSALAEPLIDPASRTWWPFLLGAGLLAVGVAFWRQGAGTSLRRALGLDLWTTRSSVLDLQLVAVRQLLGLLGVLPRLGTAWLLATTLVRGLDRVAGQPGLAPPPPWALQVGYTLVLFVAWDLSRYLLHRLMHGSSILWQFHQVHHSAEVLTPMTFHRVHPVESLLYEVRGVLITGGLAGLAYWLWRGDAVAATVLGVDAIGFVLNGLTGNLRHSHVWLGFGPRVERWLLSPAQHQLHHGTEREEHGCNYGVWLALWDRLGGSLRLAGEAPPRRIGLPDTIANHRQDLASALLGPFAGAWRRLRPGPRAAALLALVAPSAAVADEAASTPSEEMIVTDAKRKPTVGGAAHEVGEEELERYEQDDIHKVLAHVPGVYVRGEEGFGLRPNIGMRGASSDRSAKVTLLEDGIPLAPAPYAAPAAYYFPLTTRLVGVEVFKGPSAIAHGPQTIGGAVNLQSRRVPDSLSGALDTAVGSFSTLKLHGWGGSSNERGGFVVEGAHLSSGGYKELDGGGPTGFERQDALAKGRLEFNGDVWRNELELKLGYGRERSNETYLGLSAADFAENPYRRYAASQRDLMTWQHTQEALSWQLSNGGSFLLRTTAYHNWLDRSWTKVDGFANGLDLHALLLDPDAGQAATYAAILRGEEDSATSDQVLILGTNDREFHNYGVQSVARYWVGNDTLSNLAELGVRLHMDEVSRVRLEDPFQMLSGELVATGAKAEKTQDSATEAQALAVYARDTLRVGRFVAVPGVRVETIRTAAGEEGAEPTDPQTRTIALPGLALSAEPNPWLMTFVGVHRGFSPVAPGSDAATEPETAWNAELGARLNPGSTYAEVAAFGSWYENIHGQCTLSAGCIDRESDRQFNGGEAFVAGVESVLTQELPLPHQTTLAGSLSYTYTWTAFQSDFISEFPQWGTVSEGDELPYVPAHQGGFELRYETPRVGLALSGALRGEMRDVAGQGEVPDEELIPASATFDLAGDFRINDRVKLYTVVRNLTNTVTVESLRPYGARPGAPLAVMAGVKVQ
jgi:Fe(3+) dicitrate transport protein